MDNSFLVGQTIITTLFYVWCLIIAGALLYFIDGLLPLLRAYYKVFFDPHREIATKQRQITTSAKIAAALLVSPVNYTAHCCSTTPTPLQELAGVLAEHLTLDTQVKLYRGTVLTILQKGGKELPLDVDEKVHHL